MYIFERGPYQMKNDDDNVQATHPSPISTHPPQAPSRLSRTTASIASATYARFEEFRPLHINRASDRAGPPVTKV